MGVEIFPSTAKSNKSASRFSCTLSWFKEPETFQQKQIGAAASTLYSNHHKKRLPCTVQLPLANLIQFDTLTIPLSPIDLISPTRKLLDLSLCYKDVGVGLLNSNQASSLLTINVTADYHISISQPTQHKSLW
ncbi:hypothetical protein Forpi1262_v007997 [Fusarium oxysporum f. sp. raphani]|uniref:Uncharacterized protein n=1 Tax=Fusarium oxysporum f. sp. raphani TaxID=96318 RepID=A0A8J5UMP0_FUSOX|nr:hypothetical protein Forpi1262_v007997 [Fusarium oxysporum f. sp. raphani]